MTRFRRIVAVVMVAYSVFLAAPHLRAQTTQPTQQDEFVPIDQLPPQDQLPAAPLLISAYIFVIVAVFGYLFSVARRLARVQQEMARLEGDLKRSSRT